MSGSFDPTGAVFLTGLPDRVDVWDAASGERRGSFGGVQASSPDNRYLAVVNADGPPQAGAFAIRLIDAARHASVLSIPVGPYVPRMRFSPDTRFLVIGLEGNPGPGVGELMLHIVDLPAARVVARVRGGYQWAIGPAGRSLFVGDAAGARPGVHAYDLATGRPIGEFTAARPALSDMGTRHLSSWLAPDDRRVAVPVLEGAGPAAHLRFLVWQPNKPGTVSIDWNWANTFDGMTTSFSADGSRLLISGLQNRGTFPSSRPQPGPMTPPPPQAMPQPGPQAWPQPQPFMMIAGRPVIELWDLAAPRRLMSTADSAPELALGDPKLLFNPRERAFATFHDPSRNPDGIGAILWETATGKVIGRYQGSMFPHSLDGGYLHMHNHSRGAPMFVSLKSGEVRPVPRLSPSLVGLGPDRRIAVSQQQKSVTLTDMDTGQTIADLAGQSIIPAAYDADGRRLATRGAPGLNVWEVGTGKLLRSVGLVGGPIGDVHFSPDGRRMTCNVNDRFRVLDLETGRVVAVDRPGHRAPIRAIDLSSDGALIASAGDDAAVCLWEAATGRFVAMLEELTEPIAAVVFSPDGRGLLARAATGRVQAWRIDRARAGDRIVVVATPAWEIAAGAVSAGPVFVSRGRLVAFGAADGTISLREAASGRTERTLGPESGRAVVVALAARPDGQRLAAADPEGVVRLWEPSAEGPPIRLATGQDAIRAMALGADTLAVAGGSLELWDTNPGQRLVTLEADARAINGLELSPDGRILAAGDDKTVTLRDLEELRRLMAELDLGW
jgi:WD40 repeat protein